MAFRDLVGSGCCKSDLYDAYLVRPSLCFKEGDKTAFQLPVQDRIWLRLFFILIWISPCWSIGQISGKVSYWTGSDRAVPGAGSHRIAAYVRSQTGDYELIAQTTSHPSGSYVLDVPEGQYVKLFFGNESGKWQSSGHTPAVRFVKSPATDVNWAWYLPEHYVSPQSFLVSAVYINGSGNDSLSALTALSMADTAVIKLATSSQVGSLWGVAYNPVTRHLYTAALAKRHVGYGPLGTGGIYRTDWPARHTTGWLNLKTLGVPTGEDHHEGLRRAVDSSSIDGKFMADVGRVSLGGMDISPDGRVLYVMNLQDQTLYAVKLPADTAARPLATDLTPFKIPTAGCAGGTSRPFAVKAEGDYVYVGAVCDAGHSQSVSDLKAIVYALNPATKRFQEVFAMPLNYPRGTSPADSAMKSWNPWTDDFNKALHSELPSTATRPQPILSSIAFDPQGAMILGFMDRFGHQSGTGQPDPSGKASYTAVASGDILRVFPRRPGSLNARFTLENNAAAGDFSTEGKDNAQGPKGGEFFFQDDFVFYDGRHSRRVIHQETGAGGVLALPSTGEILMTAHEPTREFNSGGIKSFFNQDGKTSRAWLLYGNAQPGTFGKANGVGGLALITGQAPVAAGNRVWSDTNRDGIQDPDEPSLAGISLELYEAGSRIATTRSDADGMYLFDEKNVRGGLKPETAYEIRIRLDEQKLRPTLVKQKGDSETDSDAGMVDNYAVIAFRTGAAGVNRHDLDFGFLPEKGKSMAESEAGKLMVYPNPAVSQVEVKAKANGKTATLRILDASGRPLQTQHIEAKGGSYKTGLNLTGLSAGSYVVSLDESGTVRSAVVVKRSE